MNAFVWIWISSAVLAQMSVTVDAGDKLNITVFYESLCPDSINFVTRQLYPTSLSLRQYMNVEFVPFGKAYISSNPWRITCQHGRRECMGNAVQACALARNPDKDFHIDIVNCFMSDRYPPSASEGCARRLNFSSDGIEDCAVGEEGQQLLTKHGERTRRFKERLSFVPTVLFNDEYSTRDQKDALRNLKSVVCRKLENPPPHACNK